MNKLLIVCGPTGAGKTGFAINLAKKFSGELVSADSRQVYKNLDIVTGKDLPVNSEPIESDLNWRDKKLSYYMIQGIKVWLYDVVEPTEEFNVSYWRETAELAIKHIYGQGKLPIVVGGTGLYIKSLLETMENIDVPIDSILRSELSELSPEDLFDYLNNLDSSRAARLNESDRRNPRRLVRAIEVAKQPKPKAPDPRERDALLIGLTAPLPDLDSRIAQRVQDRIARGAREEFDRVRQAYDPRLPSLTASGYQDWEKWSLLEKQYARRQLTWFKKMKSIHWFNIAQEDWQVQAVELVQNWYNG